MKNCITKGLLRNFSRKLLLLGWKPVDLPEEGHPISNIPAIYGDDGKKYLEAFEHADLAASDAGGCYRDSYTILYLCAALAVLFSVINVSLGWEGRQALTWVAFEAVMLSIIAWVYRRTRKAKWHEHWVSLRFQSEFLRCLPMISAHSPEFPSGWYMPHCRTISPSVNAEPIPSYLQVLHHAHNSHENDEVERENERRNLYAKLRASVEKGSGEALKQTMIYAEELAKDQRWYHCRSAQREMAIEKAIHVISMSFFLGTVVAVLCHFFWHSSWLIVFATVLPACAASLHGFLAHEETERLAARYSGMAFQLDAWLNDQASSTEERLEKLIELLMSEVSDWQGLLQHQSLHIG